jgi:DNA invertase Pin-like site-specific DNA recombinase
MKGAATVASYCYVRVSTEGQNFDPQTQELLRKYPDAQVVSEIASGAKARPMLRALLDQLAAGDILIVAALDRLGRRTGEILGLVEGLTARGIVLKSEREHIDLSTPIGKVVVAILASVAELERNMISERTRHGIEAARAKGKQIGRPKTITDEEIQRGVKLVRDRGYSITRAAKEIGISYPYLSMALRGQQQTQEKGK